mmetsp:Transcript_43778/g.89422  ORF Transcript_43778/g.89422 Transcript_43778/m.89422 type:complete len:248 (-) Transcript_43778:860-1603(-)
MLHARLEISDRRRRRRHEGGGRRVLRCVRVTCWEAEVLAKAIGVGDKRFEERLRGVGHVHEQQHSLRLSEVDAVKVGRIVCTVSTDLGERGSVLRLQVQLRAISKARREIGKPVHENGPDEARVWDKGERTIPQLRNGKEEGDVQVIPEAEGVDDRRCPLETLKTFLETLCDASRRDEVLARPPVCHEEHRSKALPPLSLLQSFKAQSQRIPDVGAARRLKFHHTPFHDSLVRRCHGREVVDKGCTR